MHLPAKCPFKKSKNGIWNGVIWEIGGLMWMAGNHRSTVIMDKVYKAFFHCNDYHYWAHRPDQALHSTFILALEVKFELALHQQNEGYDTDNIYYLPKPLKRPTCSHVVTTKNKGSIDPWGSQGGSACTPPLTRTGRAVEPLSHRLAWKCLNFSDMPPTIMECKDEDKEEEYFPTAPLDEEVWLKEQIPERDLCIHMAPRRPETNYTSWELLGLPMGIFSASWPTHKNISLSRQQPINRNTCHSWQAPTHKNTSLSRQLPTHMDAFPNRQQLTQRNPPLRQSLGMNFWVAYISIHKNKSLSRQLPTHKNTSLSRQTTYLQEYISKQAATNPEEPTSEAITWDEVLSDLLSNMLDIVDNPNEQLVQEFILESWV